MPTDLIAIPQVTISRNQGKTVPNAPDAVQALRYRAKKHPDLPHVVKFSGGRSSALLLFTLLQNNILKRERGDVVVFNNTSAEHPETYNFVAECKRRAEAEGIPFFMVEFQTYEDARQGEWKRIASYRLVNEKPFSTSNPNGFKWKGEVFEEMLSLRSFLPNRNNRICTKYLKLEVTRQFLNDWFSAKDGIPHQGHGQDASKVNRQKLHRNHLRNGGNVPEEILLAKKRYVLDQNPNRPQQYYADFSTPAAPFTNESHQRNKTGKTKKDYLAFIGLRSDEPLRITRVETRSANPQANAGYEGEHVYMPLAEMNLTKEDVKDFWLKQQWDLKLPHNGALSNCAYCFLKGAGNLGIVHQAMAAQKQMPLDGFGSTVGTPCDIDWWIAKEKQYGRDLTAEKRERSNPDANSFIGFFQNSKGFSYETLAASAANPSQLAQFADTLLPCDCTE